IRFGLAAFSNTARKSVEFQSKLVDRPKRLLEPFSADLSVKPSLFLKSKCRRQGRPALFAVHVNEGREHGTVRSRSLQNKSACEVQPERNSLFYFLEPSAITSPTGRLGRYRILSCEPAACVHTVDPKIHQWSTAAQLAREQPCRRVVPMRPELSEQRMDDVDPPQLALRDHLLERHGARFVVFAVGRHELHFVPAARLYHLPGLLHGRGERLLAQHVLACLRCGHGILLVLSRRSCNVDGLNLGILQAFGILRVRIRLTPL